MRISFVSSGIVEGNRRVQPWSYLLQGANALRQHGHQVFFLSDYSTRQDNERNIDGFPVIRLPSLQEWPLRKNKELVGHLSKQKPDLIFLHVGLTSLPRLNTYQHISMPVAGIFTSPIYSINYLVQLGLSRLIHNRGLSTVHVLGSLTPTIAIQRAIERSSLRKLVVECETTRSKLIQKGVRENHLALIKPVIGQSWFQAKKSLSACAQIRGSFGFTPDDFVIGYFGSPSPLRGLDTLIRAVQKSAQANPRIRLLILSRILNKVNQRDADESIEMINLNQLQVRVRTVTTILPQERLIEYLYACDTIALPFELVPSDVPMSILETMALGIPLITSNVACIPEMVPNGAGICVPPCDVSSLADAIQRLANDLKLRQSLVKAGREQASLWASQDGKRNAWSDFIGENGLA